MKAKTRSWITLAVLFVTGTIAQANTDTHLPLPFELDFSIIPADTRYDDVRGYGYEPLEEVDETATRSNARLFSVKIPEGNYQVILTLAPTTTVKAESRRLVLEPAVTADKKTLLARSFFVNVRTPALAPPKEGTHTVQSVRIKPSEAFTFTWDEKLTLEFSEPTISTLRIEPAPSDLPTVFLVGDSTVTDQLGEDYASWGQMLPRFLPGAAVANYAHSGETIKSSLTTLRIAKVLAQIRTGDFLLIQFGHNDQKPQWMQTYVTADSTYPAYLRVLIAETRLRGATPILVTSMQRRSFDADSRITNTHGDYPQAVRQVAEQEHVALIDLDLMSRILYESLGPERAPLAFASGGRDSTHHNNYGAYALAQCVAQGIRDAAKMSPAHAKLAAALAPDFSSYNPAKPSPPENFHVPPSPRAAQSQPAGN